MQVVLDDDPTPGPDAPLFRPPVSSAITLRSMFENMASRWREIAGGDNDAPLPVSRAAEMDDTVSHCGRSADTVKDFFRWFFFTWDALSWGQHRTDDDAF